LRVHAARGGAAGRDVPDAEAGRARPGHRRRADAVALPHERVLLAARAAHLGLVNTVRGVPAGLRPDHHRRPAARVDGAQSQRTIRRPGRGVGAQAGGVMTAVRHVLLLVQGALAGLVAAETLVLALVLHNPVLLWITVVAAAGAVLPVVLAFGLM